MCTYEPNHPPESLKLGQLHHQSILHRPQSPILILSVVRSAHSVTSALDSSSSQVRSLANQSLRPNSSFHTLLQSSKKKNPHDPGLPLQAEFESILGLNREANITCKLGPVLDHPQAKRTGARTRAISGFGSSRSLIYSNTKIAQIHSKSPSWMDFVHLHKSIGTFILSIASLSSCSSSR